MSKINKWQFYLIYLVFSSIYASNCLAAGGGNGSVVPETNTTTSSPTSVPDTGTPTSVPDSGTPTSVPETNSTYIPTGTASDLNTNTITNPGIISYPTSAFSSSSSFSGYSSFGNQCGLSISGGYINNGYQDTFQVMTTFNTNPCVNQKDLENIRQENETNREVVRANTQIINTCINARIQAAQNNINPDTICKLSDFQLPRSP